MVSMEYLDNVVITHALKHNESSRTFRELVRADLDKFQAVVQLGGNEALFYTKIPVSMDSILYVTGIIDTNNWYPKEYEAVLLKVTSDEEMMDDFMATNMAKILLYDLKRKVSDEFIVFE